MRQIKFRGRAKDGKFVYGDLIHKDGMFFIRTSKSYRYYEVDPESIRQLVGHDIDGAEVYEGDVLESNRGDTFGVSIHIFPGNVCWLKLKGEGEYDVY